MEQISIIEKHIINNRKERVKATRETGKRRRAAVNKQGETEQEITCTKRIKPNHTNKPGTPIHINNQAILGANGSPESKWNNGFLLSGSLSEAFTASSSNFDEDTLSECSRFRMPLPHNQSYLFSDDEENQAADDETNCINNTQQAGETNHITQKAKKIKTNKKQSKLQAIKEQQLQSQEEEEIEQESSSLATTTISGLENARERISSSSSRQHPIPRPPIQRSNQTSSVNSASFLAREHTKKWSEEETYKFLKGLELFGTDFSMISRLFPSRTRKMCKNKFRKEEKLNLKEIEQRLLSNRKMRMRRVVHKLNDLRLKCLNLKQAKGPQERIAIIKEARRARFDSFNSIDSYDITVVETIEDQLNGQPLF